MGAGSMGPFLPGMHSLTKASTQAPIKPKALQPGDTIGLVSPASIVGDDQAYDEVVAKIKQLGYEVKEGANARNTFGYFAGTDKQRAEDLNAMFQDPSVDAIMAFRGGWGCNRILAHLDFELIKQHPKILIGYSDITTLLLAIYAKTGLTTFHGPVGTSIWTEFTKSHFTRAVNQSTPLSLPGEPREGLEGYQSIATLRGGKARGRLLGGNLSVLTAMIGSDYLPEWEDSILFLEDVGEDVYRIDRMLTQLKLSGMLNQLSGFIFGQCTGCDMAEEHRFTLQQILEQHIRPLNIPAFSGAIFGHIDDMVTLPVGLMVEIDALSGDIMFQESAVSD